MSPILLALFLAQAPEDEKPPPTVEEKAAENPPVEEPPTPWSLTVSAGATFITGNVTSFAAVGGGTATRKTEKTITQLKAFATYGEKLAPTPVEVLALSAGITGQFDYRFNSLFSVFIGAGMDADHVKSIEARGYGDLGVGALWVDRKAGEGKDQYQKALVKTDLGLRVQPESRFQYYPTYQQVEDQLLVGPRLAAQAQYSFTASTYVREELEVLPNVVGQPRVLFNSVTKVAVGLIEHLSVAATFTARVDSLPAPGKLPYDTILAISAEANF